MRTLYFCSVVFSFFSSPNLSCHKLNVYHTCTPYCEFTMQAETRCARLAENTGCKKSPKIRHRTTLSCNIFATKAHTDNRKKNLLISNISSTCSDNMVNFGTLAAEIGLGVWGTPANFNGFYVLQKYCRVLQQWASAKLCGVEQRAPPVFGRQPSRWASAHILVLS